MKKSLKNLITVSALAIGSLAAATTPAMANNSGSALSHVAIGGTSVGEVVNGRFTVAYDCTITATGAVVSVSITKCQLSTGGPNLTIALPGPAATTAGIASVPLAPYTLCLAGFATYLDSSTRAISTCEPLLPLGGGLPQGTFVIN